ncbi:hypothetical protein V7S43_007230 [Phytophthora oleae]|uniref:Uncharacterized protein n=1 Tax=Phytophthora oleae TaxID=2107226 RepID=A0ABD3FMP4_9STRA
MTQASEELEPCCVCELGYIGDEIRHETLTQALVQSMTKCLDTPKTSVIPGFVVDQYDASHLGLRLKGLMLFPPAIRKEGTTITISICSSCLGHITRRTDEQAVALVLPCVSLSVVTGVVSTVRGFALENKKLFDSLAFLRQV